MGESSSTLAHFGAFLFDEYRAGHLSLDVASSAVQAVQVAITNPSELTGDHRQALRVVGTHLSFPGVEDRFEGVVDTVLRELAKLLPQASAGVTIAHTQAFAESPTAYTSIIHPPQIEIGANIDGDTLDAMTEFPPKVRKWHEEGDDANPIAFGGDAIDWWLHLIFREAPLLGAQAIVEGGALLFARFQEQEVDRERVVGELQKIANKAIVAPYLAKPKVSKWFDPIWDRLFASIQRDVIRGRVPTVNQNAVALVLREMNQEDPEKVGWLLDDLKGLEGEGDEDFSMQLFTWAQGVERLVTQDEEIEWTMEASEEVTTFAKQVPELVSENDWMAINGELARQYKQALSHREIGQTITDVVALRNIINGIDLNPINKAAQTAAELQRPPPSPKRIPTVSERLMELVELEIEEVKAAHWRSTYELYVAHMSYAAMQIGDEDRAAEYLAFAIEEAREFIPTAFDEEEIRRDAENPWKYFLHGFSNYISIELIRSIESGKWKDSFEMLEGIEDQSERNLMLAYMAKMANVRGELNKPVWEPTLRDHILHLVNARVEYLCQESDEDWEASGKGYTLSADTLVALKRYLGDEKGAEETLTIGETTYDQTEFLEGIAGDVSNSVKESVEGKKYYHALTQIRDGPVTAALDLAYISIVAGKDGALESTRKVTATFPGNLSEPADELYKILTEEEMPDGLNDELKARWLNMKAFALRALYREAEAYRVFEKARGLVVGSTTMDDSERIQELERIESNMMHPFNTLSHLMPNTSSFNAGKVLAWMDQWDRAIQKFHTYPRSIMHLGEMSYLLELTLLVRNKKELLQASPRTRFLAEAFAQYHIYKLKEGRSKGPDNDFNVFRMDAVAGFLALHVSHELADDFFSSAEVALGKLSEDAIDSYRPWFEELKNGEWDGLFGEGTESFDRAKQMALAGDWDGASLTLAGMRKRLRRFIAYAYLPAAVPHVEMSPPDQIVEPPKTIKLTALGEKLLEWVRANEEKLIAANDPLYHDDPEYTALLEVIYRLLKDNEKQEEFRNKVEEGIRNMEELFRGVQRGPPFGTKRSVAKIRGEDPDIDSIGRAENDFYRLMPPMSEGIEALLTSGQLDECFERIDQLHASKSDGPENVWYNVRLGLVYKLVFYAKENGLLYEAVPVQPAATPASIHPSSYSLTDKIRAEIFNIRDSFTDEQRVDPQSDYLPTLASLAFTAREIGDGITCDGLFYTESTIIKGEEGFSDHNLGSLDEVGLARLEVDIKKAAQSGSWDEFLKAYEQIPGDNPLIFVRVRALHLFVKELKKHGNLVDTGNVYSPELISLKSSRKNLGLLENLAELADEVSSYDYHLAEIFLGQSYSLLGHGSAADPYFEKGIKLLNIKKRDVKKSVIDISLRIRSNQIDLRYAKILLAGELDEVPILGSHGLNVLSQIRPMVEQENWDQVFETLIENNEMNCLEKAALAYFAVREAFNKGLLHEIPAGESGVGVQPAVKSIAVPAEPLLPIKGYQLTNFDNLESLDINSIPERYRDYIPKMSARYVLFPRFRKLLDEFARKITLPKRVAIRLFGPPGTGKTTLAEMIAAKMGVPLFRFPISRMTEPDDFEGVYTVEFVDGKRRLVFEESQVTTAMRYGYHLVLDEADLGRTGVLAFINNITNPGKTIWVRTRSGKLEEIEVHERYRCWVTENGVEEIERDEHGEDFMRRFAPYYIHTWSAPEVVYVLTRLYETQAGRRNWDHKLTELLAELHIEMVKWANGIYDEDGVVKLGLGIGQNVTFTPRSILRLAERLTKNGPITAATLSRVLRSEYVLPLGDPSDRQQVWEAINGTLGEWCESQGWEKDETTGWFLGPHSMGTLTKDEIIEKYGLSRRNVRAAEEMGLVWTGQACRLIDEMLWNYKNNVDVMLIGSTSQGKTRIFGEAMAVLMGLKYSGKTLSKDTIEEDLVGGLRGTRDGGIKYEPGFVVVGISQEALVQLDEYMLANPAFVESVVNPLADDAKAVFVKIPPQKFVRHPGSFLVLSSNSYWADGSSEDRNEQSGASTSRFATICMVGGFEYTIDDQKLVIRAKAGRAVGVGSSSNRPSPLGAPLLPKADTVDDGGSFRSMINNAARFAMGHGEMIKEGIFKPHIHSDWVTRFDMPENLVFDVKAKELKLVDEDGSLVPLTDDAKRALEAMAHYLTHTTQREMALKTERVFKILYDYTGGHRTSFLSKQIIIDFIDILRFSIPAALFIGKHEYAHVVIDGPSDFYDADDFRRLLVNSIGDPRMNEFAVSLAERFRQQMDAAYDTDWTETWDDEEVASFLNKLPHEQFTYAFIYYWRHGKIIPYIENEVVIEALGRALEIAEPAFTIMPATLLRHTLGFGSKTPSGSLAKCWASFFADGTPFLYHPSKNAGSVGLRTFLNLLSASAMVEGMYWLIRFCDTTISLARFLPSSTLVLSSGVKPCCGLSEGVASSSVGLPALALAPLICSLRILNNTGSLGSSSSASSSARTPII